MHSPAQHVLIADCGSTRCDWAVVSLPSQQVDFFATEGINPLMVSEADFDLWLKHFIDKHIAPRAHPIEHVYFFGAGCIEGSVQRAVQSHFARYFPTAQVLVGSDILATRFAVDPPGPAIIGILGTGANASYFDGIKVHMPIPALGYLLGDEGSGTDLGRALLQRILRQTLPSELLQDFFNSYPKRPRQILRELYSYPNPNRYLAQYARFIHRHRAHPAVRPWLIERFQLYVQYHLTPIKTSYDRRDVYLTGGVATLFVEEIEEVLNRAGFDLCGTCERPIEGLARYALQHGELSW